jgi:anti-sigma B factor antagonist
MENSWWDEVYSIIQGTSVTGVAAEDPRPERPTSSFPQRRSVSVALLARPEHDAVVATVVGELDLFSTPHLRDRIDGCFAGALPDAHDAPALRVVRPRAEVPRTVVLDLTGVTFLASAGLRLMIDASTTADDHGQLLRIVTGDNRSVVRILQLSELDRVLSTFVGVQDALRAGPDGPEPGPADTAAPR